MRRRIHIGRYVLRTPLFAATISRDRDSWTWTKGVVPDAVLISYDEIPWWREALSHGLHRVLKFRGPIIVDSGGYGVGREVNPLKVYEVQKALGADLSIILDDRDSPARSLANAKRVLAESGGKAALEGVVHGGDPRTLGRAAAALGRLRLPFYGVPLSVQSKQRRYVDALSRFLAVKTRIPASARIHALGCGGRTMISVLGLFGAAIFDSSSFFAQARHKERIEPQTFCHFGKPLGKPVCKLCMSHAPRGSRSTGAIAAANLLETMKEVTRLRCAMDEGVENSYLNVMVGTKRHDEMSKLPGVSTLRWLRPIAKTR